MLVTVFGVRAGEEELFESYSAQLGFSVRLVYEEPDLDNLSEAEGSEAVLIRTKKFPRSYCERLRDMGIHYLCTRSVGIEHIDLEACKDLGIECGNCNYPSSVVAEFSVMLMLMGLRKVPLTVSLADVQDYTLTASRRGRMLQSCTVGVIGTGRIGSRVIELLSAFGCRILAYSRSRRLEGVEYVPLSTLLSSSDVITLHVPGQEKPLLGREEFKLIKPGAVLVNTARGSLIDQKALLDALETGRVGYALLDVVEDEKIMYHLDRRGEAVTNRDYLLLKASPRVYLTPHMAFFTQEAVVELSRNSLEWVRDRIFK